MICDLRFPARCKVRRRRGECESGRSLARLCVCGAFLLAAGALAAGEAQVLSLTTAQAANASEATATGRIVPVLQARAGSRLSGQIKEWGQSEEKRPLDVGMTVRKDQVLFRIDTSVYMAKAEVARAGLSQAQAALANLKAGVRAERREELRAALSAIEARITEQKRDEERFRRLVEQDKTVPPKRLEEVQLQLKLLEEERRVSKARVAEAEAGPTPTEIAVAEALVKQGEALLAAAELDLHDTVFTAPFDALIAQRFKGPGDYLNNAPFTEVLELVSLCELEAELRLPETYFVQVAPGKTEARLQTPLLPNGLKLPVTRVIEAIDPRSGSFAFRVRIPQENCGQLKPGAFVQARVLLDGVAATAIVPQRAVVRVEGRAFVFVAQDGKMSRRAVVPGDELTEGLIIKSGLKPGEKLVLGPPAQLQDGAALPDYLLPRGTPRTP